MLGPTRQLALPRPLTASRAHLRTAPCINMAPVHAWVAR